MTGGAGFVGSHTVLMLLQNGFKVVVVDNLVNAVSEGINLPHPLFTFYNNTVPVFTGPKPVALLRVEKLTKQSVVFYEADLGDQKALDRIFSSVK